MSRFKLLRPIFFGIVAIGLLDTIGSVTSRIFDYEYTSLVYGSYLIYGLVGVLAYRATDKLLSFFFAGVIMGLFDSTIGWWLSDILDANVVRMAIDSITRFVAIGYVTITTGLVSLLTGWLSRFLMNRKKAEISS